MSKKHYNKKTEFDDDDELSSYAVLLGGRRKNKIDLNTGEVLNVFPLVNDKSKLSTALTSVNALDLWQQNDELSTAFTPVNALDLWQQNDKDLRGEPGGPRQGVPGPAPLSTAHKSPFLEWSIGASLITTSKNLNLIQQGGGKRGKVKGFSKASRRRLLQTIARVQRGAELPCFITLTYPENFPSPRESKNHLERFIKRIKRSFPEVGMIWKLEPQERGAPHYHILAWGAAEDDLHVFVPVAWYSIAGNGDENHLLFHKGRLGNQHCVNQVRSFRGVWSYASKYLGKTFEVAGWDEKETGRFWAIVNPKNIPFGKVVRYETSSEKISHIMRYQRRFSKVKKRNYPSLTTFCDADQWVKNIVREELQT